MDPKFPQDLRGNGDWTTQVRQQLEQRLAALKSEYEKGDAQLRQLDSQSASLRETLLRISGAIIMVLEELLAAPAAVTADSRDHGDGITVGTNPSD